MTNPPPRLRSLDALRGFDMLWIAGGAAVLQALASSPGGWLFTRLAEQTEHVEWHGFTLWDGIFPLFLFLAGVSLPFSFTARRARGATEAQLRWHALRRGVVLVLLGAVYNGLLTFDFDTQRWASVLGRIGLGWMFAALIVLRWERTASLAKWTAGILLGYAALLLIPVGGSLALEPGHNVVDWFDRELLPGRLHRQVRDPEGLLATIPAVATALSGVLAGRWLMGPADGGSKVLGLLKASGAALVGGLLIGLVQPINKNLWTPAFVLWTSGGSLALLALFYWWIDVRGHDRWCFPLIVIGTNAITIYLLGRFVDFEAITLVLFGRARGALHPALFAAWPLLLQWGVLYELYRRRLFLKV
ncbi:MAG: DUF5009 domain-containing protein [Planctomycetota bacterium]|nr:DUF5009 domain-containing protein [Planctomycetota bacterium]